MGRMRISSSMRQSWPWERFPSLTLASGIGQATYQECRELLTRSKTIGSVSTKSLTSGSVLCVKTDKDNIAAVRVESIREPIEIEISFSTWAPN